MVMEGDDELDELPGRDDEGLLTRSASVAVVQAAPCYSIIIRQQEAEL
jgi:hypothetical protein